MASSPSRKRSGKSNLVPQILGHARKSTREPVRPHAVDQGKRRLAWDIIGPLVATHPHITPRQVAVALGSSISRAEELLHRYRDENKTHLARARIVIARPGKKKILDVAHELGLSVSETAHLLHQLIHEAKKKKK